MCPQLTHTVVAQAAVGGARRPEHLAGEAVLELDHLLVDQDLLCAWWRPIACVSSVVCRGEEGKHAHTHTAELNKSNLLFS